MLQTKVAEKAKTYILFSRTSSKNLAVYEIMWKNIVEPDRAQMTNITRRLCFACFITKDYTHTHTHTHTQKYVIYCFPRKKWSRGRASILPCRYMFYLSKNYFTSIKLKTKNTFTVTRNLVPKIALKSKPVPVTFLEILEPFLKN